MSVEQSVHRAFELLDTPQPSGNILPASGLDRLAGGANLHKTDDRDVFNEGEYHFMWLENT